MASGGRSAQIGTAGPADSYPHQREVETTGRRHLPAQDRARWAEVLEEAGAGGAETMGSRHWAEADAPGEALAEAGRLRWEGVGLGSAGLGALNKQNLQGRSSDT